MIFKFLFPALPLCLCAAVAAAPAMNLLELKDGFEKRLAPSSAQITFKKSEGAAGLAVSIATGTEGYPGIAVKPEGAVWDSSAFGHVSARVANTGTKPLSISLRVDNAGPWQDNPWNTESITIKPGETGTVTTIFGFQYGKKPGYALKTNAVSQVLMFALKTDVEQSFRLESLEAGGPAGEKPPVDPDSIRVVPVDGKLIGLSVPNKTVKITAQNSNAGHAFTNTITMESTSVNNQSVLVAPVQGRWDLRDALQVRIRVSNLGLVPSAARARIASNGGPSDWVSSPLLAVGASYEIVIPFEGNAPLKFHEKVKANRITSDAVSGVSIVVNGTDTKCRFSIESITADFPKQYLPNWLGKRPPVDGDWVQTLNEEFDGDKLDASLWEVHGPNYWDKQSHFSRDNVIIGGGVVKLRYEKKTGFHDDDPKKKQTDWQSGYLHSFDKWAQRYGYFESRMKLPKAPGLWPAFWMMPDRGRGHANRQDTGNGGMEFDVMEYLTRWGPNRLNVAVHYDGYGKDHKSLGSDRLYVQPDKDGYITSGLLWTPGLAVWYCNGLEIARWENERVSNVPGMLMFTLPMGGWDNSPLDEKLLPDDFIVDYVRVWQRRDLAQDGDGKKVALTKP